MVVSQGEGRRVDRPWELDVGHVPVRGLGQGHQRGDAWLGLPPFSSTSHISKPTSLTINCGLHSKGGQSPW